MDPINPEVAPALDLAQSPLFEPQQPQDPPKAPQFGPSYIRDVQRDAMRQTAAAYAQRQTDAALLTLQHVVLEDPAKAAEAQEIARKLGTDPSLALTEPEVARQMLRQQQIRDARFLTDYPVLSRMLQNVEFAKVAQDDLDNLAGTEGLFTRMKRDFNKSWWQNDIGRIGSRMMFDADTAVDKRRLRWLQQQVEGIPDSEGFLGGAASLLGSMVEPLLYASAAGFTAAKIGALGGPVASGVSAAIVGGATVFATTAQTEAGNAFVEMVDAGYDRNAAFRAAVGVGLFNGALELVGEELSFGIARAGLKGLKSAVRKSVTKSLSEAATEASMGKAALRFAGRYVLAIAGETSTEVAQEIVSIFGESYARENTADKSELAPAPTRQDIKARLLGVAGATARGMVLLGLAGPGARLLADATTVASSKQSQHFLRGVEEGLSKGQLRTRAVDAVEQFIASNADGTPTESVYLNAEGLQQALNHLDAGEEVKPPQQGGEKAAAPAAPKGETAPGMNVTPDADLIEGAPVNNVGTAERLSTIDSLEQLVPGIKQQMQDALVSGIGGDVTVPLKVLMSKIAKMPKLYAALKGLIRLRPGDLSANQLADAKFVRVVTEATAAIKEEQAKNEKWTEELDQVEEDYLKGLEANKKDQTITKPQTRAAGTFYRSMVAVAAHRLKMTPKEFQAAHGLQVGEIAAAAQNAATAQGATPKAPTEPAPSTPEGTPPKSLAAPQALARYAPQLRTMQLNEGANLSSVLHEMSHHFAILTLALAENPNADIAFQKDASVLLDWFKSNGAPITGETLPEQLASWNAMSEKAQEPFHEQVSYNFERWLFEGVAPSEKLRGLFGRIRAWIVNAYRGRQKPDAAYKGAFGTELPALTPEVREVFARMVASEDVVDRAVSAQGLAPLFQTKEQFTANGGTEEGWTALQESIEAAREAAISGVQTASLKQLGWLAAAKSPVLQALIRSNADLRKRTEAAVRTALASEPVYVALDTLSKAPGEAKLNLDTVREIVARIVEHRLQAGDLQTGSSETESAELMKRFGTGKSRIAGKGGINPDLVSVSFGYQTGEELVRAIAESKPFDAAVEEETTRRLSTHDGTTTEQEMLEKAARRALTSDATARAVALELKALLGMEDVSVHTLVAAARHVAQQTLGERTLASINPQVFEAAASLAARQAAAAALRKDMQTAAKFKRMQLLNTLLERESLGTQDEVRGNMDTFRKVLAAKDSIAKTRNFDLVSIARWMLTRLGLGTKKQIEKASTYYDLLQSYDPNLLASVKPILDSVEAGKALSDLTLNQYREVAAGVQSLWDRSRTEQQIKVREGKAEVLAVATELAATLPDVKAVAGELKALSWKQRIGRKLQQTMANLTRIEHLFRALDGGKSGPWTQNLYVELRRALDAYRNLTAEKLTALVDIIRSLELDRGLIVSEELNYTFGNGNGGLGMAEVMGLLQHIGNESNKTKMAVGGRGKNYRWGFVRDDGTVDTSPVDRFIQRLVDEGKLTQKHFDAVQAIWDVLERLKPLMQQANHEMTGRLVKEVQAKAFTITFPDGTSKTYRGGYVPATADRNLVKSFTVMTAPERANEFRNSLPESPNSFTKERIETFRDRPLSLDINLLASHVDEVVRYALVQPRVNDVVKVLNVKELTEKLDRYNPEIRDTIIKPWLERVVTQSMYEPGKDATASALWRWIRTNNGVAIMFGNVVNSLQQFAGVLNSSLYVSKRHLWHATWQYLGGRKATVATIIEQSKFMDDRLQNQLFGLTSDMRDLLTDLSAFAKIQRLSGRWGYVLQSMAQNQVDIVTWLGRYNEVLETRNEEETAEDHRQRAVDEADAAVRLSQGSFNPEDVARFETGSPFYRTWVQFTGYFNTVFNQIRFAKDQRLRAGIVAFFLPMVIGEVIARTLWRRWDSVDKDDPDGMAKDALAVLVGAPVRGAAAFIPAWGPAIEALIEQRFSDRPFGDKVVASPAMSSLTRSFVGLLEGIRAGADADRSLTGRQVRDSLTLMSMLSGVPLTAIGRPVGYGMDWAAGRLQPTGTWDATMGLITGKASEPSKRVGR